MQYEDQSVITITINSFILFLNYRNITIVFHTFMETLYELSNTVKVNAHLMSTTDHPLIKS